MRWEQHSHFRINIVRCQIKIRVVRTVHTLKHHHLHLIMDLFSAGTFTLNEMMNISSLAFFLIIISNLIFKNECDNDSMLNICQIAHFFLGMWHGNQHLLELYTQHPKNRLKMNSNACKQSKMNRKTNAQTRAMKKREGSSRANKFFYARSSVECLRSVDKSFSYFQSGKPNTRQQICNSIVKVMLYSRDICSHSIRN